MATLQTRIRSLRQEHNLTQEDFGKIFGIVKSTVSLYENGRSVPNDQIKTRMCQYFGVSMDYLLGLTDNRFPITEDTITAAVQKKKGVRIPVLGNIQAGIPIEAIQDILDWEEIPEDWVKHGEEYIALQIRGNSMAPKLLEGDVVILRRQDDVESGDIAAVLVNGNDATIKKVKKDLTGITLIPFNAGDYDPLTYSNQQIQDLPIRVIGKLVELRRKF